MILYFSGTGNSRYAAESIGHLIGDKEIVNIGDRMKEGACGDTFTSENPFVFVCPVYSWRIPRIFQDFLMKSQFYGNRSAYFIITCGGDIGNAKAYLRGLCREKNLDLKGVAPIVMPENYIAMFDAPEPLEAEKILDRSDETISDIALKIKERELISDSKISLMDRLKSGPVNWGFYTFCVKAKGFHATSACIGCGKCARVCPLQNIHMEKSRPVWGNHCTHCMACICGCPKEAIEYKNSSKGKPRYYNHREVEK